MSDGGSTIEATTDEAPRFGPAILEPLSLRDFRLLFAGESISLVGNQFHFVALAWLTLQLTGSGLALGTVLMAAAIPRAGFMLLGGALSDRLSPRTLMLASNALCAVVVGVVAALVLTDRVELWHLYVLGAIFGVVDAFFFPAMSTILPMLVASRLLPPANALMQGAQQLSGLLGPAVAGLLVAAVQTGPAFAIDAASFAVAALAIWLIAGGRRVAPPSGEAAGGQRTGLLSTIGSGLAYAWRDPAVRSLILLIAAFNFAFNGPILVGIPYLADRRFEGGSAALGLMFAAYGGGALLGAILAGSIRRVPRLGTVTLATASGMGIGLALIGSAPNVPLAMVAIGAIGLGAGFINVRIIAWLQARAPDEMVGRVMSLVMLAAVGLAPLSLAVSGVIVDFGAVAVLLTVAGGIVVAAALIGMLSGLPKHMTDEAAAGDSTGTDRAVP